MSNCNDFKTMADLCVNQMRVHTSCGSAAQN